MGVGCSRTFNIAVNDVDAQKSPRCSRMLAVTELVVSGTQCKVSPINNNCIAHKNGFVETGFRMSFARNLLALHLVVKVVKCVNFLVR